MNTLLFALGLLLASCDTTPVVVIDPPVTVVDTGLLSLKWELPINPVGLLSFISEPLVTPNSVIFRKVIDGPEDMLFCVDKLTPTKLWSWNDPLVPVGEEITSKSSTYVDENRLYIGTSEALFGIGIDDGVNDWKEEHSADGEFAVYLSKIGNYIYQMHADPFPFETGRLVRYPVNGGVFDTLYSVTTISDNRIVLTPPSLFVQGDGDSLLIFRRSYFNATSNISRIDLIAFNLTSRDVEWHMDDFEGGGACNVRTMTIYDSKVYVMGKYTLHCFDANTGEKLWEKAEPGGLLGSVNLTIAEDKVFVKPSNEHFKAYNAQTGALIWDVSSSTVSPNGSVYYDGHLFITGADIGIFVHRASDGKLVYLKQMPGREDLYHPLAIDPATGLLFTSDGRNALCFKINL